jgi:hypothetical protein
MVAYQFLPKMGRKSARFVLASLGTISAIIFALNAPVVAHAHGDTEGRVGMELEVANVLPAGAVKFAFDLVDNEKKKVVTDKDVIVEHERILHVVIYDEALVEFQHVHPDFQNGQWHVDLNFTRAGRYWVWAQGKLAQDGVNFSAFSKIEIKGGLPANATPPNLKEVREANDAVSVLTIADDRFKAKEPAMLMLNFSRKDGKAPKLTPYLGALAHVILVPDDGDAIIHVHPMSTGNSTELMIHTEFPAARMYRLWVEFVESGVLRRVPLAVQVN